MSRAVKSFLFVFILSITAHSADSNYLLKEETAKFIQALALIDHDAYCDLLSSKSWVSNTINALIFYRDKLGGPIFSEAWKDIVIDSIYPFHCYQGVCGEMALMAPFYRGLSYHLYILMLKDKESDSWRVLDVLL